MSTNQSANQTGFDGKNTLGASPLAIAQKTSACITVQSVMPLAIVQNMLSRTWLRNVKVPLSRACSRVSNFVRRSCPRRMCSHQCSVPAQHAMRDQVGQPETKDPARSKRSHFRKRGKQRHVGENGQGKGKGGCREDKPCAGKPSETGKRPGRPRKDRTHLNLARVMVPAIGFRVVEGVGQCDASRFQARVV